MKMRLTLFVGGDNFNSKLCKKNLNHHNFNLDDEFLDIVSFTHKKEFCEYYDYEYEQDFYEFIYKNIDFFKKNQADDFRIFIEIYIAPYEQCNLEILNPEFISLLGKHNFSIPISFYIDG